MKASMHFGRGSADHNDRKFDIKKAHHIDPDRTEQNEYYNYTNNPEYKQASFSEWELHYYREHYQAALDKLNESYVKQGHPERCKTIEEWYSKMNRYQPREAIFQIGNKDDYPDPENLMKATVQTLENVRLEIPNFVPLDISLHMDEATPHVQIRFVINAHDESGNTLPNTTRGLKEMGLERPDISKPESRYNNPLMSFTNHVREVFYDHIETLGIDLDRIPRLESQHLETIEYKKQQEIKQLETVKQQLSLEQTSLEQIRVTAETEKQRLSQEIEKAEQTAQEQIDTIKNETEVEKQRLNTELESIRADYQQELKEIDGQKLTLQELQVLQQKTFWNAEEKMSILKTASQSAQNNQNAARATKKMIKYQKQAERLKTENEKLQTAMKNAASRIYDLELMEKKYKSQSIEVEQLKEDIQIRDEFIKREGLVQRFQEMCQEMHHTLHIKVQEMVEEIKHTMHFGR